ncbi:iron-containing alcohol dehydrogenase [Peptoniphilus catoniae]|uniref:iron-containing alcohol dehydrogenase n=1 Tax=Peptoniphilus catoniae TaxID=1660341 RepID=UPI0010FE7553|nr:iron-containing alcohol dehydrogenase [Peptoniphilus catoniae]
MKDFIFDVGTKILFGKDQLKNLPKEIKKYGDRVLLVYGGGSIKKIGLYNKVVELLNENDIFFKELAGVEPNPRVESAAEGVKIARENNLNFVLAVGGGSTIDCSKLISAAFYEDCYPWDIVTRKVKPKKGLPIGTILTLAATGSEMDRGSVITNQKTKQKLGWAANFTLPKFSILNPEFTYSVPKKHTAAGTADIMSHTMENYFTLNDGAYLVDRFSEGLLKTCIKYGKIAYEKPDDYEARANLMWANTWAINGLLDSGKDTEWSVHAMEHELSAHNDLTHGWGLAILTPSWLRYCLSNDTVDKICEFGQNVFGLEIGEDKFKTAEEAIKLLSEFFKSLDIPQSLKEVGFKEEDLPVMAEACIKNHKGNIKGFVELDEAAVLEIYKMSYK